MLIIGITINMWPMWYLVQDSFAFVFFLNCFPCLRVVSSYRLRRLLPLLAHSCVVRVAGCSQRNAELAIIIKPIHRLLFVFEH